MNGEDQGHFETIYRDLADDALLKLAMDHGLRNEAKAALRVEVQRRSLTGKDVKELQTWREKQKPPTAKPVQERVILGTGVRFVGHKFLSEADKQQGIYVSTEFFVLKYGSVFPIGSYRVKESDHGLPGKIERVNLQRDQVWQEMKWSLLILVIMAVIAGIYWVR